jgi:hypothetical protein
VTWNVANSSGAPINCANVKISLSTDGGNTFPITLTASTPNDGSETVSIPNTPTTTARIKVEAVGNVFFDISNTNFSITGSGSPPATLANISTRLRVLSGDNVLIGGLIATGTANKRVILRAIGPSLTGLGVPGALAVSALAGAGTSVLLVATEEFRVRTVLFWFAGGLDGRGPEHLRLGAIFILPGCAALLALARPLDVLSLGEEEAGALSLPVHATRMAVFVLAALVAGPATALAGSVPFVGLVAPHALRPLVGSLARRLLPASFLAGAVLVVIADLVARTASEHMDLPLGSITAFVGAPYFLFALRAQEGRS